MLAPRLNASSLANRLDFYVHSSVYLDVRKLWTNNKVLIVTMVSQQIVDHLKLKHTRNLTFSHACRKIDFKVKTFLLLFQYLSVSRPEAPSNAKGGRMLG